MARLAAWLNSVVDDPPRDAADFGHRRQRGLDYTATCTRHRVVRSLYGATSLGGAVRDHSSASAWREPGVIVIANAQR
jgi:hypothetical protein